MLDIKFIRENKEAILAGAKKKLIDVDLDKLIDLDDKRLEFLKEIENLRGNINAVSDNIAKNLNQDFKQESIEKVRLVKEELKEKEAQFKSVLDQWQELMLKVPNIPDASVPEGASDLENQEVKTWGSRPSFDFEPKNHIEIMNRLSMVDFERGTSVHGFRGYFLLNDGARLSFAIWNYAMDFFSAKGFIPVIPPVILNQQCFMGTGYLPQGEDDLYKTQDSQYLAGTAEVPVMALHANEVLKKEDLPRKYLGFSPCFRREAGSHGKDVKGLIRVHEFYKVEQVVVCEASHDESVRLHEEINRNTEEFIESLGIPYRTVANCGGDLGLGQVKKYDIELWVPKEGKYREISSASYFHDFQCRRSNIKYKTNEGNVYAHSLNCTAIPTPRILVSLIENYQQSDGSIKIPDVLAKYLGKAKIG